jgi:IPT/TIG domain
MNRFFMKILLMFMVVIFSWGCENDYPDSIYNSDATFKANPIVTSISPEIAFAGVDTVDIVGENFASNPNEIAVYFNGAEGEIISTSPNLIRVIAANVINDSVKVQVRVDGALEFAEFDSYKLEAILINYGNFDEFDNVFGIECDLNENVYISLVSKKIEIVSQDLERTSYVTDLLLDKSSQMKFGPEGELYSLNGVRFLVRIEPNGGNDGLFATLPGNAWDMDFDSNQDLYLGGGGEAVYKVTLDKQVSTVMEYSDVNIKAIRVFDNYVYVAGEYSGDDANTPIVGVWRNQIISGSETLGETEVVFDFDANYPGFEILSLEIAEDGDLYLGTTAPEAIITVHPGGNFEPLYAGVLTPNIYAMTWGNGEFLYLTRRFLIEDSAGEKKEIGEVLRINMRKKSAPYFGRK